jgi:hypothetical protein
LRCRRVEKSLTFGKTAQCLHHRGREVLLLSLSVYMHSCDPAGYQDVRLANLFRVESSSLDCHQRDAHICQPMAVNLNVPLSAPS